jgi:ring-1,2-phenylacetyl-CoA epoxidase subunit PaaA
MDSAVPVLEEVGLDVPAHYDEDAEEWVVEYDFPVAFEEEEKNWRFDTPISWDDVIDRWRSRGPANERYVSMLQSDRFEPAMT